MFKWRNTKSELPRLRAAVQNQCFCDATILFSHCLSTESARDFYAPAKEYKDRMNLKNYTTSIKIQLRVEGKTAEPKAAVRRSSTGCLWMVSYPQAPSDAVGPRSSDNLPRCVHVRAYGAHLSLRRASERSSCESREPGGVGALPRRRFRTRKR